MAPITLQRWGKHWRFSQNYLLFFFFPSIPPSPVLFFLLLWYVIPISCVPGQPTQSQCRAGASLRGLSLI